MNVDSYNFARFLDAQQPVYATALEELRAGRKRTHWMWFIFPQLRGLGRSSTARYYAITGRDEAQAYLAHPVLGARLLTCTRSVMEHREASADAIFGYPDNLKFHSSMTLFAAVEGEDSAFAAALRLFFKGKPDDATLGLLQEL